tara:strand:- start:819 stop:959 length:141 start_codon:yes stop_codon:yes gene_type:complete
MPFDGKPMQAGYSEIALVFLLGTHEYAIKLNYDPLKPGVVKQRASN